MCVCLSVLAFKGKQKFDAKNSRRAFNLAYGLQIEVLLKRIIYTLLKK